MSEFDLDRDVSIEKNVDAFGKRWMIHVNRQNGLCYVRPDPDRSDAVIPDELQGLWTKPSLLQPKITDYLNKTWDKAAVAQKKAERKAHAEKVEKKANDSGSTKK